MRFAACALFALTAATPALAQSRDTTTSAPAVLTLNEAVALARRNNPTFQQSRTARNRAGAALRSSYAAVLPDVSTSFGTAFREGGQEIVAGESRGAACSRARCDERAASPGARNGRAARLSPGDVGRMHPRHGVVLFDLRSSPGQ